MKTAEGAEDAENLEVLVSFNAEFLTKATHGRS